MMFATSFGVKIICFVFHKFDLIIEIRLIWNRKCLTILLIFKNNTKYYVTRTDVSVDHYFST